MIKKKYKTILVDSKDGITTVKFNRPEKRNAMSPQLHMDMDDVLTELEYDKDTKVLILTGAGEAFCAGQDLKEYFYAFKDNMRDREEFRKASHRWRHEKLNFFPKPTIAMVNGWCFGGAFTIVASCDIVITAEDATFGLSEINFAHMPGGLVSKVVADLMLPRPALYYILTGEPFSGKRAVEVGYATMAVPKKDLLKKTMAIAEVLKAKDETAFRASKEAFKGVDIKNMSYHDAWMWLKARSDQQTMEQKGGWLEQGIGKFMKKEYRPGLQSVAAEKGKKPAAPMRSAAGRATAKKRPAKKK